MFKSIFQKLLFSYICVLLIGFGFIAWWMNYMMKDFIFHQKEVFLQEQMIPISHQLEGLARGDITSAQSKQQLYDVQHSMHIRIDFVYRGSNEKLRQLPLISRKELIDPTLIEDVFSGMVVHHTGTFKKRDDISLLSMGFPFKEGDRITGALFLHTPVYELNGTLEMVQQKILISAVAIAVVALIILYLLSRKISEPLIRMNKAATMIGKGKFSEKIQVKGKDEVSQLADTFNQMVEQLERLEKNRKELIMNVSHELRTPVTSVRGFIQGIIEKVIHPEQHHRYLTISLKELERLSTLISKMLDLSAIESGTVQLNCLVIRWATLVESVIEGLEGKIKDKKIDISVSFPNEMIKVYGDPDRLKQILINLLDNSIRFTPEGGIISITSEKKESWIEVKVTDSGIGIASEDLPHIWDRFFTADWSRSTKKGSGLGLTIAKHLVELHGGSIRVDSKLQEGTVFTLSLPSSEHNTILAIVES
jgi:signal transduction histidine kinase